MVILIPGLNKVTLWYRSGATMQRASVSRRELESGGSFKLRHLEEAEQVILVQDPFLEDYSGQIETLLANRYRSEGVEKELVVTDRRMFCALAYSVQTYGKMVDQVAVLDSGEKELTLVSITKGIDPSLEKDFKWFNPEKELDRFLEIYLQDLKLRNLTEEDEIHIRSQIKASLPKIRAGHYEVSFPNLRYKGIEASRNVGRALEEYWGEGLNYLREGLNSVKGAKFLLLLGNFAQLPKIRSAAKQELKHVAIFQEEAFSQQAFWEEVERVLFPEEDETVGGEDKDGKVQERPEPEEKKNAPANKRENASSNEEQAAGVQLDAEEENIEFDELDLEDPEEEATDEAFRDVETTGEGSAKQDSNDSEEEHGQEYVLIAKGCLSELRLYNGKYSIHLSKNSERYIHFFRKGFDVLSNKSFHRDCPGFVRAKTKQPSRTSYGLDLKVSDSVRTAVSLPDFMSMVKQNPIFKKEGFTIVCKIYSQLLHIFRGFHKNDLGLAALGMFHPEAVLVLNPDRSIIEAPQLKIWTLDVAFDHHLKLKGSQSSDFKALLEENKKLQHFWLKKDLLSKARYPGLDFYALHIWLKSVLESGAYPLSKRFEDFLSIDVRTFKHAERLWIRFEKAYYGKAWFWDALFACIGKAFRTTSRES